MVFLPQQVVFIGEGPPYVSVRCKSAHHILPVQIILIRRHLGKAPAVIGMHNDDIRFDPQGSQFLNAVLNVLEMLRVESIEIPVIPMIDGLILAEVFSVISLVSQGVPS